MGRHRTHLADVMNMVAIAEREGDDSDLLFARIRYRGTNFTINNEGWDSEAIGPQTSGWRTE